MLKELREKRANLIQQAQEILDLAEEERRLEISDDEQQRFDSLHEEADRLAVHIRARERQQEEERAIEESLGRQVEETSKSENGNRPSIERRVREQGQTEVENALRAWLLAGSDRTVPPELQRQATAAGINTDKRQLHINLPTRPPRDIYEAREMEIRALSNDPLYPEQGAYTVPETLLRELEVALLTFGGMRQGARVLRTADGGDFRVPTVNDTTNKGRILDQNTQVQQKDVEFSQVVLGAYKYSSDMVLVPVELLQDNAVDLAGFLGQALGERLGRITNEHFTVGTGSDEPNGIVTASTLGKAGSLAAGVTYGEIVDLEHSVDPAYRTTARWMFHDKTLAVLKKLEDGDERPLWQPGLAVRQPDTLMGYPYIINNDMPEMGSNGRKSIIFGDLSKYWIRDVVGVTLLRLDERFADFHQVAFLAFSRHDADLINAGTGPVRHFTNGSG